MSSRIEYSDKYNDSDYEYRHVILPKELARNVPKSRCMTEAEWRGLGVQQSRGWVHYAIHRPEPHVLLFKRPLGCDGNTGIVNEQMRAAEKEKYMRSLQGKVADPSQIQG
ncbi:cyclin-dependent kinase regulatory subunit-domain-containing protein [Tribonema minus]|uniref:Cyclin-dependent kinases regulatory subunit n=1 Tax=Tribonema minus TaxID=303371 RepID=A0A835YYX6_9STRA|nr:cyclin-dependent kinase regulatory subunit-domain-containing protein [Tribonema minus]|eukprot:TRINITY_DN1567_c0_g1_i1.p1 TRINITY_DN1567_c0_g1~~TRINITY_DN1567_c0_g1_i1.p1  ORF type:complete len:110 (-),score=13.59 TRINITY_DN1567_c0_g1_i1:635-964(-)